MRKRMLSAVAAATLAATGAAACSQGGPGEGSGTDALTDMGLTTTAGSSSNVSFGEMEEQGGRFVFTDVVIRNLDEDPDDDTDGPDELHAARLIIDQPRFSEAGDILMDSFALEQISFVFEDEAEAEESGDVTIARFGIDGPNAALSNDIARMLAGTLEDDHQPAWADYAFEAIGFEGMSATGTDADGTFEFGLEQFVMQDFSGVELGRFAIIGLNLTGQSETGPIVMRLSEMSLLGLQSGAYVDMMQAMSDGGDEEAVLASYYQSAFSGPQDTFDSFTLRDLAFDISGVAFNLDTVDASMERSGSQIVSDLEMGTARLVPDAGQPGGAQLAMGLGMLGYEALEMTMESHSVYEEDTGRAYTTGENFIEIRDAMRIDFTQDLGGYTEYMENLQAMTLASAEAGDENPMMSEDLDAMAEMLDPLTVNSMTFTLRDLSLLDRALTAGAAAQGMTKEELRMQSAAMIGMGLMAAPPEVPRPLLAELSAALTNFVNQGGALTIAMEPAEPVSLGAVMREAEAGTIDVDRLGLSVTAEAPE